MYTHYTVILENVPREILKEMQSCLNEVIIDMSVDMDVSTKHSKHYACIDVDIHENYRNKVLTIVEILNVFDYDIYIQGVVQ